MTEETQEAPNPPERPITLGRVRKLRDVRRALVRVANAVLAGRITVPVGNHCVYALSSVGKVMETELLESRLEALEERAGLVDRPKPRGLVGHA